jgi:cytochrome c biogenesis protein CcmG, thiol:disulfide interchange protein DsbE
MTCILSLLLFLFTAPAAQIGHSAPDFSRPALNGQKIILSSYRGKVVLLNFWATWCGPCLVEMPAFVEWQKQYGPANFQVIGVSMDDAAPEVRATVSKLKLNYPVLMGDESLGDEYGGILGLPVTFLIDRDGKIRARYEAVPLAQIQSEIQRLLQSRGTGIHSALSASTGLTEAARRAGR